MIAAENMEGAMGEQGSEEDGNNRLDPFLQPPILKALFEQLPLEDLARCRLMSKLWCDASLSTWRSKATLKFGKEGMIVSTSTRNDSSGRTTSLGEFLDLWKAGEWGSCPFKKFNLHSWDFTAPDMEQRRFLQLAGRHITSLSLFQCSFGEWGNFRRIIYQAFPNLQFLKLDQCKVDNDDDPDPTTETLAYREPSFGVHELRSLDIVACNPLYSMMDMLSHFHKLKNLHLRDFSQDYHNLLETIRLIRAQDQSKLPLNNFDVNFPLELGSSRVQQLQLLKINEQLKFPLQRLTLTIDYYSVREEDKGWEFSFNDVIRNILRSHSSTLKYLKFRGSGSHGLCKSFPFGICLNNLEELTIESPCFTDNLNYLKYTPNLRVLEIGVRGLNLSMADSDQLFFHSFQLRIGDWTLPSLMDLRLGFPVSLWNVTQLMKWMPNLERLWGLRLDDVTFSMVCENWSNLKYLRDDGYELSNEGVIGIGNVNGPCANITKLKNLISFVTRSSKLTYASVREGFLKLDNLRELRLGQYAWINDEAKAALKAQKITFVCGS